MQVVNNKVNFANIYCNLY